MAKGKRYIPASATPFRAYGLFSRDYLEKVLASVEIIHREVTTLSMFASPFEDVESWPYIQRCVDDINELTDKIKLTLKCPF